MMVVTRAGSMERPALQQMLTDVRAGRIDVVVVYKIDRLTRSLADFGKIVEVLEAAGASFVSVTQAFSTTTSMGRLTLNVLLSFAQFEREVIAERIRDKVAASKAKGMWMGGGVPLGYSVKDRKLIVDPDEAATVRMIMARYLESPSIRVLVDELRTLGVVTKRSIGRDGSARGGIPFRRGALAWLLSNRVYVGETVHKGTAYPGQHKAIVDREMFDAVQQKLAGRTVEPAKGHARVSLLAGMIRDDRNRPMSPFHTRNHGRRYSYYASNMNDDAGAPALRLPAGELEAAVRKCLANWLRQGENLQPLIAGRSAGEVAGVFNNCALLAELISDAPFADARSALKSIGLAVLVSPSQITATIETVAILALPDIESESSTTTIVLPTSIASYGHEPRLRLEPTTGQDPSRDERLMELVARAFSARNQLLGMDDAALAAMPIAKLRHVQRTARLSYLDPTIIRKILNGTQPRSLSARELWRMPELPLSWAAQREALGLTAA